jgi:hypothetical protein
MVLLRTYICWGLRTVLQFLPVLTVKDAVELYFGSCSLNNGIHTLDLASVVKRHAISEWTLLPDIDLMTRLRDKFWDHVLDEEKEPQPRLSHIMTA